MEIRYEENAVCATQIFRRQVAVKKREKGQNRCILTATNALGSPKCVWNVFRRNIFEQYWNFLIENGIIAHIVCYSIR